MSIVWEPPRDLAHECEPPMRDVFITGPPPAGVRTNMGMMPASDKGTIWQCGFCGQMWTVDYFDGHLRHGYTPSYYYWRISTWRETFKARRMRWWRAPR